MKHSLSHGFKLVFARIRWVLQALADSEVHAKVLADKDKLMEMRQKAEQNFLLQQRLNPTFKDTYIAEGYLKALNDLN
jgi:hypothetical protein